MDAKKVGQFIQDSRKQKKYTQGELAELLGVTDKAISRWETGDGFPEITMIPKLAHILGVSADEILSGERQVKTEVNDKRPVNKLQFIMIFSLIIMITGYCIGLVFAYALYNPYWPLLPTTIFLAIGIILYIYGRYNFLNESSYTDHEKKKLFTATYFVYTVALIIIAMYIPFIAAEVFAFETVGYSVGILSFLRYISSAAIMAVLAWLLSLVIALIHYATIYKRAPASGFFTKENTTKIIISVVVFAIVFSFGLNIPIDGLNIGSVSFVLAIVILIGFSVMYWIKKQLPRYSIATTIIYLICYFFSKSNAVMYYLIILLALIQFTIIFIAFHRRNLRYVMIEFYWILISIVAFLYPQAPESYVGVNPYDQSWKEILVLGSMIVLPVELIFYFLSKHYLTKKEILLYKEN